MKARLAGVLLLALAGGCGPAQLGADEEAFKAVDALYTAVAGKSPKLLDQCERKLRALNETGKLPNPAYRSLEAVVASARDGQWRPAAEELSRFMKGQRRPKKA
jgi:hypothetical protein